MAYLRRDGQDPDGLTSPVDPPATSGPQTRGSVAWAVALTVIGWVVLAPGALVIGAFSMFALSVSPDAGGGLSPAEALKFILVVASAVGAPIMLGLGVYRKSATLGTIGAFAVFPALYGLVTLAS